MYYIYTDEKLDLKKIFFWVLILKQGLLTQETFYSALICVSWTTLIYLHWRFAAVLRASIIDWHIRPPTNFWRDATRWCIDMRSVFSGVPTFFCRRWIFKCSKSFGDPGMTPAVGKKKKKSKWDRPFRSTIVRRGFTSLLLLWLRFQPGLMKILTVRRVIWFKTKLWHP